MAIFLYENFGKKVNISKTKTVLKNDSLTSFLFEIEMFASYNQRRILNILEDI